MTEFLLRIGHDSEVCRALGVSSVKGLGITGRILKESHMKVCVHLYFTLLPKWSQPSCPAEGTEKHVTNLCLAVGAFFFSLIFFF